MVCRTSVGRRHERVVVRICTYAPIDVDAYCNVLSACAADGSVHRVVEGRLIFRHLVLGPCQATFLRAHPFARFQSRFPSTKEAGLDDSVKISLRGRL